MEMPEIKLSADNHRTVLADQSEILELMTVPPLLPVPNGSAMILRSGK